ncbi:hypothetical protein [Fictibacillus sp. FJAT-27399]|uniref:hypothetical protein n=1 Tax=Fictibacillus sp. FJAT-27399 TaxID=1729689 RepID=UPI0012E3DA0B|nr:hypothetical protein [Fictibacillus sp. FJAT-27399]
MISVPGFSLSAGRALNPSALAPAGFICHASPAGVSNLPLQSTCHCRLNKRASRRSVYDFLEAPFCVCLDEACKGDLNVAGYGIGVAFFVLKYEEIIMWINKGE